jgi:hypothetical protein
MNSDDEHPALKETGDTPVVVHPGPPSVDQLLLNVDPAPDDETERFVAAIYAERRHDT